MLGWLLDFIELSKDCLFVYIDTSLNINPSIHDLAQKRQKTQYAVFYYYICTAIALIQPCKYNTSWYLKACPTDKRTIGLWGYNCLLYTLLYLNIKLKLKKCLIFYIFLLSLEKFSFLITRKIWNLVFEKSKRSATKYFKIFIGEFAFLNRV